MTTQRTAVLYPAHEGWAASEYMTLKMQGRDEEAKEAHDKDRAAFVINLGLLLTQTDNDVTGCDWLPEEDAVVVHFTGGDKTVNVAMDSYAGIIRDVMRRI